ncbi:MAG: polysaccharide deacetylase family protein [Candidatus Methylomirabilales bacterium]
MDHSGQWATTSRDVLSVPGPVGKLRGLARDLTLKALYPPLALRDYLRPDGHPHLRIVYYHFVFDDEWSPFEEHVRFFRDYYDVLPLGDALDRLRNGCLTEPSLVITFDDGFKNNRTNAAEALSKYGFSACFYVTSTFVSLGLEERRTVEAMCQRNFQLPIAVQNMDWDDVRWLRRAGHEIGSHTMTHAVLTACGAEDVYREIVESKAVIEQHLGESIRHFSVPFGRRSHYSPGIRRIVCEAGYESCALNIRGSNLPRCDLYQLRRDALVAGWSVQEVRTHLLRTASRTHRLFRG